MFIPIEPTHICDDDRVECIRGNINFLNWMGKHRKHFAVIKPDILYRVFWGYHGRHYSGTVNVNKPIIASAYGWVANVEKAVLDTWPKCNGWNDGAGNANG